MIRASSRCEAPRVRSERTRRSRETDGSPVSILATRDWLDRIIFARSIWVSRRWRRRSRRLSASLSFSSMYAASSSDRPRNSLALPTFQPLASRRFLFSSRIVVLPESLPTGADHRLRRRGGLLAKHLDDHNGIRISAIY